MKAAYLDKAQKEREREAEKRLVLETLKRDIRDFLWLKLPPEMNLDRAEGIANDIYEKINDTWEEGDK